MNTNKLIATSLFLCASTASTFTYAAPISLSGASDYNAFFFDDFTAPSADVEGRLAVGGDAYFRTYSVNRYVRGPSFAQNGQRVHTDSAPVLVVGGDANVGGLIDGNVRVGGSYYEPFVSTTGVVTQGVGSTGLSVDFASVQAELTDLSNTLSQTAATGSTQLTFSNLTFDGGAGDGSGLHYFDVSGADLDSATTFGFQNIASDDTVIINVSGSDIDISGGDFSGLQSFSENVLFNFYQATDFDLNTAFWGSTLAVGADINCSSAGGVIWGQVVANSWGNEGNGCNVQINYNPFEPVETTEVPEPPAFAMMVLGLLSLVGIRRRQQRLD